MKSCWNATPYNAIEPSVEQRIPRTRTDVNSERLDVEKTLKIILQFIYSHLFFLNSFLTHTANLSLYGFRMHVYESLSILRGILEMILHKNT